MQKKSLLAGARFHLSMGQEEEEGGEGEKKARLAPVSVANHLILPFLPEFGRERKKGGGGCSPLLPASRNWVPMSKWQEMGGEGRKMV